MGLNYSINLDFPASRVGAAFRELAGIAAPGQETVVRLRDGEVGVPFSSNWKHEPVELAACGSELEFETAISFLPDEAIRGGDHAYAYRTVGGQEQALVGYIYLKVRLGCLYAEFSFTAATSGMSRLFVASESVRGRFRELLSAAGGAAGWLDMEDFELHSLDDPNHTLVPEAISPSVERAEWSSPDHGVAALCQGLGRPLPEVRCVLACRTPDTVGLARAIASGKAFDLLPVLADALQDAGCTDEAVLHHCRCDAAGHTAGCWITDLILGRG